MSNLCTYIRAPSTVSCVLTLSTNCDFGIFSSPKIKATSWSLVIRIPEIHHVVPWFSQHFIAVKCFLSSMASSGISHFAERTNQQHGVARFVAAAATNPVYFGMWSTNQRTTISIWDSLTYSSGVYPNRAYFLWYKTGFDGYGSWQKTCHFLYNGVSDLDDLAISIPRNFIKFPQNWAPGFA